MHCQIAGQDLLLNIRMWRNTAEQWLPANGYAHAALLHKDTLGPVCFSLSDCLLIATLNPFLTLIFFIVLTIEQLV